MRATNVQSSAQNKRKAFACYTPYGKESWKHKDIIVAVAADIGIHGPNYMVVKRGLCELVLTFNMYDYVVMK